MKNKSGHLELHLAGQTSHRIRRVELVTTEYWLNCRVRSQKFLARPEGMVEVWLQTDKLSDFDLNNGPATLSVLVRILKLGSRSGLKGTDSSVISPKIVEFQNMTLFQPIKCAQWLER